jgi:glycerol 2-dehydrogenase (NADP+)
MEDKTVQDVAEKNKASPAQVVLSWAVQRGTIVVPKSEDEGRMLANITVRLDTTLFQGKYLYFVKLVPLSKDDMEIIDGLHQMPNMHKSLLVFDDKPGTVFGWTYDQLGWSYRK